MATKKKRNKSAGEEVSESETPQTRSSSLFPIVGVGASAGGIEAFNELLRHLPESPGVGIVFVLHQEAKHTSTLPDVFARSTKMRVVMIADGAAVEPNVVYVAPPANDVTIKRGVLRLQLRAEAPILPIDTFFRSLADDQGTRAIAVVLSGAASDGSLGVRNIKAEGGITFAQDDSARFRSMPSSAVAAGGIDFVLSPQAIADELMRIAAQVPALAEIESLPEGELQRLFGLLRATHDIDFTHYKPSTIDRRVRRRMALHRADTLREYLKVIRTKPEEVDGLYNDLLIRVTGFFRDAEVFEALQRDIYPAMLRDHGGEDSLRVWVPGCATGEEVYSIAISLLEATSNAGFKCPVQIFGTDVSEPAVERARAGIYPEAIAAEVSPERLKKFFSQMENGYRVSKAVRDCCIFARQDLTKDPPFSKLDLISCRNVMIYLGAMLQRKVMSIFHYALRPNGYLLLGSSETIGSFGEMFEVIDRTHKIYRRKRGARANDLDFQKRAVVAPVERQRKEEPLQQGNPFREADRIVLSRYSPPGILINDDYDVLQFRGRTSAFLEPPPGAASFNLLKMLREGLLADVRTAVHRARRTNTTARREGVVFRSDGDEIVLNIEAIPFVSPLRERLCIILFEEVTKKRAKQTAKRSPKLEATPASRLKRELDATREYLQSIIEEQEAMNEELRSANEEIQSSNEELQSTNEELETAKEELQSSNEELTTLNEELENRNQDLTQLGNDVLNILTAIEIPVLILDSSMRLRRANPAAQRSLNLQNVDIGRRIGELKTPLAAAGIDVLVSEVIEQLEMREVEVEDVSGERHSLRIRPYRTSDNKIDGAVLVLLDSERSPRKASR